MLLQKYDTPTDIVISGRDYKGITQTFSITDDYSSFLLLDGTVEKYPNSTGFVFVMTKQRYLEIKELENEEDESQDLIFVNNFQGSIHLYYGDENVISNNLELCNLTDYIEHQIEENSEYVVLKLEHSQVMVHDLITNRIKKLKVEIAKLNKSLAETSNSSIIRTCKNCNTLNEHYDAKFNDWTCSYC